AYNAPRPDLPPLPNNPPRAAGQVAACPDGARHVRFNVSVVTARRALPGGTLTYNSRAGPSITHPPAILSVLSDDPAADFNLTPGVPTEPLILRAAAGDCIDVTLTNLLDPDEVDINGQPIFKNPNPDRYPTTGMPPVSIYPSARAGLHAQLLQADV